MGLLRDVAGAVVGGLTGGAGGAALGALGASGGRRKKRASSTTDNIGSMDTSPATTDSPVSDINTDIDPNAVQRSTGRIKRRNGNNRY